MTTTVGDSGIRTDCAKSVAIDSRGRIVAGGYVWTATGLEFLVGRYLADGQLDPSFGGGDGLVSTSFATGDDSAYAVAIGPGDQIYAAGFAIISTDRHFGVAHLNADGTLTTSTTQYVYSPRYIDAVICRDVADGATLVEGSRLYYTSDANHNVTALLSADGDVVERTLYTPYGQALVYAGNWSETHETSTFDNTHLYTGRVYDGAIDLIYFRNRWYDAGVGQFISRDPIGYDAGDVNLYRYVGGMPTGHVDPRGTSKELAELLAMGFTPEEILALGGFTAAEISAYVGYNILVENPAVDFPLLPEIQLPTLGDAGAGVAVGAAAAGGWLAAGAIESILQDALAEIAQQIEKVTEAARKYPSPCWASAMKGLTASYGLLEEWPWPAPPKAPANKPNAYICHARAALDEWRYGYRDHLMKINNFNSRFGGKGNVAASHLADARNMCAALKNANDELASCLSTLGYADPLQRRLLEVIQGLNRRSYTEHCTKIMRPGYDERMNTNMGVAGRARR